MILNLCCCVEIDEMTVIRQIDSDYSTVKELHTKDSMLQKHWGSTHTVNVYREPNKSLGISIVGGKVDINSSEAQSDAILGIFVKEVVPNSPAGKTGQFKTGDRILEVSGVDLRRASHDKAVQAIRNSSNPVTFVIQSLITWNSSENDTDTNTPVNVHSSHYHNLVSPSNYHYENDVRNIGAVVEAESRHAPPEVTRESTPSSVTRLADGATVAINDKKATVESESSEDDDMDSRELEGRTMSAGGQQIDRASAANIRRSKDEIAADPETEDIFGYTLNKVKKKYASLGHTVMAVQLERGSGGGGLGLSLAGHRDRNCMAVFVCGLHPDGVAKKSGSIEVGDEILEVNGVVLHGRCHLNASAIIKGLSGPIFKIIILRRKTAIDDIAVKPITQFPVSLAEETSEEHFSTLYPNVRTVQVKKGTQSLGIMIIEGKHAEVGQGIFISDIQEGSAAERAGLEIGEMILAVNKDSIVGSNYDNAASLLKRTEGLVTLVISNPGKKDAQPVTAEVDQNSASKLKPGAPGSRPATPVPEPPADPATCPITPGKDTVIELNTDNKGLGVFFVGGKDTLVNNGIVIVEVYPGGAAEKDGRLQPGDQIIDINGTALKDITNTAASQALRQTLPKIKMTVYRPANIEYTPVEVELIKKPGKGLGLSVLARKSSKGVYVADIVSGGIADLDGKIARGDLLVSVNGQSVENSSGEEGGAILKTVTGKVTLKLNRYKPTTR